MSESISHRPIRRAARVGATARAASLALGLLFAGAAAAAPPLKTIEECVETGTRAVSLPGVAGGTLAASPCAGCAALRLQFEDSTRYFIGEQSVSYAKFRDAAGKGDLRLDVFYDPRTGTLTRLRLAAAGGAQ